MSDQQYHTSHYVGQQTTSFNFDPPCEHKNWWHVTVRFWIFKKTVFVCSDCGEEV